MRKFWIMYDNSSASSTGRRFLDLNAGAHSSGSGDPPAEHAYLANALMLTNPSGLGVSVETDFSYGGALSYVCTRNEPSQIVIAGILNVIPNGVEGRNVYLNYLTLVPLICNKLVTLLYCPYSDSKPEVNYAYRVDGYVTKLTKTEKKGGVLACGFEFRGITPWYRTGYATPSQSMTAGSSYTFTTPGAYGAAFDMLFKATTTVSHFSAVITRNGEEIGALVYDGSIASGKTLEWSSDPTNRSVTYNGASALNNVDLLHNIFPLIKQGDVITFGSSMTGTISFTAYYKIYYGGV